jgi:hypothetical protein
VLYTPFDANDAIFGGLGNDSIHAGAGNDAVSGAEAQDLSYITNYSAGGTLIAGSLTESDFSHPFNPGSPLGYSPRTTKFALFDANEPLRKIVLSSTGTLAKEGRGFEWFLNFDPKDGPVDKIWTEGTAFDGVPTDADDRIFGDLGDDWLVGGTGRDTLWGGWGNDLLPFANPGLPTVIRTSTDDIQAFLLQVSQSQGADLSLIAQHGGDPARNGEPFGELGMVIKVDVAWNAQQRPARDPQPGNLQDKPDDVDKAAGVLPIWQIAAAPAPSVADTFLTASDLAPSSPRRSSSGPASWAIPIRACRCWIESPSMSSTCPRASWAQPWAFRS